jgi:hypothetical protein
MFLKMKKKETDLIPQQSIGTLYLSNLWKILKTRSFVSLWKIQ